MPKRLPRLIDFPRELGGTFVDRVNGKKSGDSAWSLEVPPNVSLSLLAIESHYSLGRVCQFYACIKVGDKHLNESLAQSSQDGTPSSYASCNGNNEG